MAKPRPFGLSCRAKLPGPIARQSCRAHLSGPIVRVVGVCRWGGPVGTVGACAASRSGPRRVYESMLPAESRSQPTPQSPTPDGARVEGIQRPTTYRRGYAAPTRSRRLGVIIRPGWWNWQTRRTQNPLLHTSVRVQVPPRAPQTHHEPSPKCVICPANSPGPFAGLGRVPWLWG